uniref:Phosphatidylinositol N-acetylglucosaminyltransferase subunit H conserved domain-containing protein n=1 Tax=Chromera velia CCMP2878 TaxID=1169474 RepID=A0A0G4IDT8_9ALVE|eukprot:Cvel_13384.t1-p1 / transcript=Cvel_13384.t1 / gene=Cvel_13384 / organism=Chromera_velia_CCMP2878 / gene_product=Phosphatidylinositol, putative / transcript_product=Phosphatidylinositol, putative / location=Cvel_scaffold911:20776-24531(-) / protein_length=572 / sequence_SO=supercontig / SO=protein_coding / is_pseudo=false
MVKTSFHVRSFGREVTEFKQVREDPVFSNGDALSLWVLCAAIVLVLAVPSSRSWSVPSLGLFVVLSAVRGLTKVELVKEESLTVIDGLGVQLQTTFLSGKEKSLFVDAEKIEEVVVNEGILAADIIFFLGITVRNQKNVVVPFQSLMPRLPVLLRVWAAVRSSLSLSIVQQTPALSSCYPDISQDPHSKRNSTAMRGGALQAGSRSAFQGLAIAPGCRVYLQSAATGGEPSNTDEGGSPVPDEIVCDLDALCPLPPLTPPRASALPRDHADTLAFRGQQLTLERVAQMVSVPPSPALIGLQPLTSAQGSRPLLPIARSAPLLCSAPGGPAGEGVPAFDSGGGRGGVPASSSAAPPSRPPGPPPPASSLPPLLYSPVRAQPPPHHNPPPGSLHGGQESTSAVELRAGPPARGEGETETEGGAQSPEERERKREEGQQQRDGKDSQSGIGATSAFDMPVSGNPHSLGERLDLNDGGGSERRNLEGQVVEVEEGEEREGSHGVETKHGGSEGIVYRHQVAREARGNGSGSVKQPSRDRGESPPEDGKDKVGGENQNGVVTEHTSPSKVLPAEDFG